MRSVAIVLVLFAVASCASLPSQSMSPEEWYQRGVSFLRSGQYDEALGAFSQAIELNPQHSEAYRNRGLAWAKKGELDRAISDYTRAVEINPEDSQAYRNRAIAWSEKGELKRGLTDAEAALTLEPNRKSFQDPFPSA
jgi:tetratricopeptide (TPR) repeat protein